MRVVASHLVHSGFLPADDLPALLTIGEAAQHLRCSVKSVRRYVKAGRLPAFRAGGRLLFTSADLWALLHGPPIPSTSSTPDPTAEALGGLARDLTS